MINAVKMCQQGFNYREGSWLHIFAFSPKHAFLWSTRLYLCGVYHSLNAVPPIMDFFCAYTAWVDQSSRNICKLHVIM